MSPLCCPAPGDPEALRRELEGWAPRIGSVLGQVDKAFRWALYDREPLATWTKGLLANLGRCFLGRGVALQDTELLQLDPN